MELYFVGLLFIQGLIMGAFSGFVANEKGRDAFLWFLNGLLFSLIALIAICGVPPKGPKAESTEEKLDLSFD